MFTPSVVAQSAEDKRKITSRSVRFGLGGQFDVRDTNKNCQEIIINQLKYA